MSEAARPRGSMAPVLALVVAAVLATWAWTLRLPLTGVDVWSILVQAKTTLAHPSALLHERYLEGLWDGARFWRPGYTAFSALEFALFGTRAWPWHLVRLALVLGVAVVAGRAAARRGAAPRLAFVVAALVYALHPIQVETLPVTSRDADTLFPLLALGGLVLLARARACEDAGRTARPALAGGAALLLCAPLVKEPGLLSPALGALMLVFPLARAGAAFRARLVAGAVLLAGLALHVVYRLQLMGTIGRYERDLPITLGEAARELVAGLFDHQRLGLALAVFAALAAAVWTWRGGAGPAHATDDAAPAGTAWIALRNACAAWAAIGAVTYLTSPVFRLRYAEGILAPLAVLAGAGLAAAWARGRRVACAGLAAACLVALVPGSPLVWSYPQWELTARAAELTCAESAAALRDARAQGGRATRALGALEIAALVDGNASALRIDPFPFQPAEPRGFFAGRLANVVVTAPYALQSCLELRGEPRGTPSRLEQGSQLLGLRPADLGPAGNAIRGY